MATVYLRKAPGARWFILNESGTIITGPHRWGNVFQAIERAQLFCSTWNWQLIVEEGAYESADRKDTVPPSHEPS